MAECIQTWSNKEKESAKYSWGKEEWLGQTNVAAFLLGSSEWEGLHAECSGPGERWLEPKQGGNSKNGEEAWIWALLEKNWMPTSS